MGIFEFTQNKMPKSKRQSVVTLNKTKRKVKANKSVHMDKIEKHLKKYKTCFVFQYKNMTTAPLKELQEKIQDSKFCFAKRRLMQIPFGKPDDEPYTNSHLVAKYLKGDVGLLFSNKTVEDCEYFFKTFAHPEFANPGESAITTVELMPGTEVFQNFSGSNEQYLRKLGLDLAVEDAKINLEKPFLAAEVGQLMNVNQTRVLKFLGIKLAEFKLTPVFRWERDGTTKEY